MLIILVIIAVIRTMMRRIMVIIKCSITTKAVIVLKHNLGILLNHFSWIYRLIVYTTHEINRFMDDFDSLAFFATPGNCRTHQLSTPSQRSVVLHVHTHFNLGHPLRMKATAPTWQRQQLSKQRVWVKCSWLMTLFLCEWRSMFDLVIAKSMQWNRYSQMNMEETTVVMCKSRMPEVHSVVNRIRGRKEDRIRRWRRNLHERNFFEL